MSRYSPNVLAIGTDYGAAIREGHGAFEAQRQKVARAAELEQARAHDQAMARLQAELGMTAQKDAQQHALTLQGNQFGQERDILGTQQQHDRWRTQFQIKNENEQRGFDRGVQKYGIDQNVGVANRRLSWDQEYGRGQLQLGKDRLGFEQTQYTDQKTAAKQYRPVGPVDAVKALYPFGMPDGANLEADYNRLENLQRGALGMDPIGGGAAAIGGAGGTQPFRLGAFDPDSTAAEIFGMTDDPAMRRRLVEKHIPPENRAAALSALDRYERAGGVGGAARNHPAPPPAAVAQTDSLIREQLRAGGR